LLSPPALAVAASFVAMPERHPSCGFLLADRDGLLEQHSQRDSLARCVFSTISRRPTRESLAGSSVRIAVACNSPVSDTIGWTTASQIPAALASVMARHRSAA